MTTKTYPRAKVSRHKVLEGWTIELLLRAGAKPIKVNATYATIEFAHRSALTKLGIKAKPAAPAKPASALQQEWKQGPDRTPAPAPAPAPAKVADTSQTAPVPRGTARTNPGTCKPCGRPMRPAGTKAADHPGTTLRQREGLCQPCNFKAQKEAR